MVLWSSHADRLSDEALLVAMGIGDQRADRRVRVPAPAGGVRPCGHDVPRTHPLAEDIAQQTFERVLRHAASFDVRRGTAKVWLLTITRRLCIDAVPYPSLDPR